MKRMVLIGSLVLILALFLGMPDVYAQQSRPQPQAGGWYCPMMGYGAANGGWHGPMMNRASSTGQGGWYCPWMGGGTYDRGYSGYDSWRGGPRNAGYGTMGWGCM